MQILEQKIILASQSPRRKQLMEEAGFNFIARSTDIEENYPDTLAAEEVAPYLAKKKAMAARSWIEHDEIILAADSVVVLNNKIYEKPKDYEDAVRILKELSGQTHRVITGVC